MNRDIISTLLAAALMSVFYAGVAVADDTEVYLDQINLPADQLRPNVIFILDSSGSMGLPLDSNNDLQEEETYDRTKTYTGSANTTGGSGNDKYLYLYEKPDATYADQYIYYNKVHVDQMSCHYPDLNNDLPYTDSFDGFIFNDGTTNWSHMCAENDANCAFNSGSTGQTVDCAKENNDIGSGDDDDDFPTPNLHVVNANFHNFLQSYYRYAVMQTVVKDLIDTPFDINLALMKFNGSQGGIVIKESVDANLISNQTELKKAVNSIRADGLTPLAESLWEAMLYLRGEKAEYGNRGDSSTPKSVTASFVTGTKTYQSPIEFECQKSHIILMTDGQPHTDNDRDTEINDLVGATDDNECSHNNWADAANESCLDDLAKWLHYDGNNRRDHAVTSGSHPSGTGSENLTGRQSITVHTIGFGLDNPLLDATAQAGGNQEDEPGLSETAATASELADAFSTILNQANFESDTFVAPAVAVNAYNGLQHRDEVYFALFKPNASPRWSGNIKKYTLDRGTLKDQRGAAAIDEDTGFFNDQRNEPYPSSSTALSYWTELIDFNGDDNRDGNDGDGSVIVQGGAASLLDNPSDRKIYTYTGTPAPDNQTLSLEELEIANEGITTIMLQVDDATNPDEERTNVLNWARGGITDGTPAPNYFMADLIHNRPSVVTYVTDKEVDSEDNVTDVTFEDVIFAASNMGFFHALNAETGEEIFSFVPKELFPNLTTYYQNSGHFSDKVYGLDAPMTVWRHDEGNDGSIVSANGVPQANDHVYIYQAMRRGGASIYALDVSRLSDPKLMWQINGDAYATPPASPTGDFKNLAQTWSVPQRGKIRWGCSSGTCTDKEVLFFGGGYDTAYDNELVATTNTTKGNAIYMVDAEDGKLLWSAGSDSDHDLSLTEMTNSIPADVTIGDVDSDGYIDFLFAVDIRGGLWRVDFVDRPSGATNFATGGKIAQLGETTGATFRHFYNAPDVALFRQRGRPAFLTISLTSGYRAHPRDGDVVDGLFVVIDRNALSAPAENNYRYVNGTSVITTSDLAPAKNASDDEDPIDYDNYYGWTLNFDDNGEKGLSRTITFDNKIIATTYVPSTTSTCLGSIGNGRYYILDALNGESLLVNSDSNTSINYRTVKHGGIPPEPAVIFSTKFKCVDKCGDDDDSNDELEERTNLTLCIGTECIDGEIDHTLHRTFWRENNAN
jgi:type IV pilus assembly protein PilY1